MFFDLEKFFYLLQYILATRWFWFFLKKIIYSLISKWNSLGMYKKKQIDVYYSLGKNLNQIGVIFEDN